MFEAGLAASLASGEVEWREGQGNTVEALLGAIMAEPRGGRGDRRDLGVIWWDRGTERWQWSGLPLSFPSVFCFASPSASPESTAFPIRSSGFWS